MNKNMISYRDGMQWLEAVIENGGAAHTSRGGRNRINSHSCRFALWLRFESFLRLYVVRVRVWNQQNRWGYRPRYSLVDGREVGQRGDLPHPVSARGKRAHVW